MAFLFSRQSKNTKTWYVGYYVDRKYVRKRIGRSKAFAEKASLRGKQLVQADTFNSR